MSDNAPENVSEVNPEQLKLGVLHSLTRGIQDGVGLTMKSLSPMVILAMMGQTPSPKQYDAAMSMLTRQLSVCYELAELIEKLYEFDPTGGPDLSKEQVQALKKAIYDHPIVQKGFAVTAETSKEHADRIVNEVKNDARNN